MAEITIPAGSTWRLSYAPYNRCSGGEPNGWITWTLTTTPTTPVVEQEWNLRSDSILGLQDPALLEQWDTDFVNDTGGR